MTRPTLSSLLLRYAAFAIALVGCASSAQPQDAAPPDVVAPTGLVGPSGGTVLIDGVTLVVPAGAVEAPVTLTVARTADAIPAGHMGYSPVYRFGPEGIVFARPVQVRVPFEGAARAPALYWSRQGAPGFERMSGVVSGGAVEAPITHFSEGFVGDEPRADAGDASDALVDASADIAIDVRPDADRDAGPDAPLDTSFDLGIADIASDIARDAGADATVDAAPVVCPGTAPGIRTACPREGLECEYDATELRAGCRGSYRCESTGLWNEGALGGCFTTTGRPVSACAMSEADAVSGSVCGTDLTPPIWCTYPTRTCWCQHVAGARWTCDDPTSTAGCPARLPLLGAACPTEGLHCSYGPAATPLAGARTCTAGRWQ